MKKNSILTKLAFGALPAIASLLLAQSAFATPYASSLTNNGGTVSFRLNEAADNVRIIWNGGANTNTLGPRSRGLTVTNIAGLTGVFFVQTSKIGDGVFTTNSAPVTFNSPRGIAVNANPATPYFGRVYVANSAAAAKGDGIYALNADLTDVFGTNRTGGINFALGGSSAPYRISVGFDDSQLYICDWSDLAGNLWVTDPDVTTNASVFKPLTGSAAIPATLNNNHGSLEAVAVKGSLANSNLTVFFMDEDLQLDRETTSATQMNSLWRYDVFNAAPFVDFQTNLIFTPAINFVSQTMDLSRGPNDYLYVSHYRSSGNEAGVYVVTNGLQADALPWNSPFLWNSKTASADLGYLQDVLKAAGAIAASRDGRMLAHLNSENNSVTAVRLTNGIPDLTRIWKYTGLPTTGTGRGIAFDAADNIYIVSSGITRLQSLTLGITATATTGSDGTFVLDIPQIVGVVATDPIAHEETPANDTATFTFNREGDVSAPLTVNLTISGTAVNGTDYQAIPTSVTFPAGSATTTVTITPIDDSLIESPETVILKIASSASYSVLDNASATAVIADNETPLIGITGINTNMYEPYPTDFARLRITRLGETNIALSVNIDFSGGPQVGADFMMASSATLNSGDVTATFDLNPMDNSNVTGIRSFTVTVANAFGGEYTPNSTNKSVVVTITDDDLPSEAANLLWSETFDNPQPDNTLPADWTFTYGTTNNSLPLLQDYKFTFGYDYGVDGIPAAPGAVGSTGLKVTVNKNDTTAAAAGINFYPAGKSFANDFALRFSLLIYANTTSNTTEHAIFGINHSGTKTNWYRSGNVGLAAANMDGLFFSVDAVDGAATDFTLFTKPSFATNTNPLILVDRTYANFTNIFKNPPFVSFGTAGSRTSPTWADVEVSKTTNMVALRINNTLILQSTNTTGFNAGNIMLGYMDCYDSIGGANGAAYFDNVRVVKITPPVVTANPVGRAGLIGGTATLSVSASSSTGTLNYQWMLNGAAIAGATGSTLTLTNVQAANLGAYYVIVNDGRYPVSSAVAVLSQATAPTILVSRDPANVLLRFNTQVGPAYDVEYKQAVTDASWTLLQSVTGTGSQATVSDPISATTTRLYRVKVR
ncbi:MAG: hypothetical protein NTX27_11300 [Verrucomicrobia bacterium]|nr:hypothetical protein [Verrucomicrobiota bacterium]